MRTSPTRSQSLAALIGVTFVAFLIITNCDDTPTKPKPKDISYSVFFGSYGNGFNSYRYDIDNRCLDSALLPSGLLGWYVPSADGSRLYFPGFNGAGGNIIDSRTWQSLGQLPFPGFPQASPDGKTLAICGDDFYLVRESDYHILFRDTLPVSVGNFGPNGTRYFGELETDSCRELYIINLEHDYAVTRRCLPRSLGTQPILASRDESRLYFYQIYNQFIYALQEYDVALDSIVFEEYLTPGDGTFAMPADGRQIWFTNADVEPISGPPPPYAYARMDVQTHQIDTTAYITIPCDSFRHWINEVVVTPDGKWAIGLRMVPAFIVLIDMARDSVVDVKCFDYDKILGNLTINNHL